MAMIAQSALPHMATFTWAPSCASHMPLGSADAELALKSAINIAEAAMQSFMASHLAKLACTSKPKS